MPEQLFITGKTPDKAEPPGPSEYNRRRGRGREMGREGGKGGGDWEGGGEGVVMREGEG